MKKLLIITGVVLAFTACSSSAQPDTIDVSVNGSITTITPQWLKLDNGDEVAIDAATGNKYNQDDSGNWVKYVPSN